MPLYSTPLYPDTGRVVFWDDFIMSSYDTRVWAVTGSGSVTSLNLVGGRIQIQATASNTYRFNHNNFGAFAVASNAQITWRGAMTRPTGGTGGTVECGLQATTSPTTNLICWKGLRGTTNFQCLCTSGGTTTTTDSGVAFDTNDHEFFIETVTGSVNFYLDGVLRATITTNIPSGNMQPYVNCAGSTTLAASMSADWVQGVGARA
jgi:hypothetical protein